VDQGRRRSRIPADGCPMNAPATNAANPLGTHEDRERAEPIRAAALAALHATGYRALSELRCEVCEGVATLSGVLPSFYLLQLAQQVLQELPHIKRVRNLATVQSTRRPAEGAARPAERN
jgi:hypothetical protein